MSSNIDFDFKNEISIVLTLFGKHLENLSKRIKKEEIILKRRYNSDLNENINDPQIDRQEELIQETLKILHIQSIMIDKISNIQENYDNHLTVDLGETHLGYYE